MGYGYPLCHTQVVSFGIFRHCPCPKLCRWGTAGRTCTRSPWTWGFTTWCWWLWMLGLVWPGRINGWWSEFHGKSKCISRYIDWLRGIFYFQFGLVEGRCTDLGKTFWFSQWETQGREKIKRAEGTCQNVMPKNVDLLFSEKKQHSHAARWFVAHDMSDDTVVSPWGLHYT